MTMHPPSIFLSYSLTKAAEPTIVRQLLALIKSCVSEFQWTISDPLESSGDEGQGIRERVAAHIYRADAIFAECSMAIPNVMYEIGFARALRYPAVLFVNEDIHRTEESRVKEFLRFLDLTQARPLTSDLGDIEYFKYSKGMLENKGGKDFNEQLGRLVKSLAVGHLSDGARLLRRNAVGLQKETFDIFRNYFEQYHSDHPIFRFVAGWNERLLEELRGQGRLVFEVDASSYQSCLSTFQSSRIRTVRAIADLTDSTESFWESSPDPLKTSVTERIFVVSRNDLLNKERFAELCRIWRKQREEYSVRVVLDRHVTSLHLPHHFGRKGHGQHLLLIDPDVVGGYVSRDDQRMLHIESNVQLHKRASESYEKIWEESFAIEEDADDSDILRAWMLKDHVGIWNPEWKDVETRDSSYFTNYDIHIRFWVPFYDQLIEHSAATVEGEIARLMRLDPEPLDLLEIGYGTGSLTAPLLSWIQTLNEPYKLIQSGDPPIRRYIGVDRATQMRRLLNTHLSAILRPTTGAHFSHSFIQGVAVDGLRRVLGDSKFSVICGSLVLHDMFGPTSDTTLDEVLQEFRKFLRPKGSLVWADAFFAEDKSVKERQLQVWKNLMNRNGMTEAEVATFLVHNPEMIDGVNIDTLRARAEQNGFTFENPGPLPGPPRPFPFRVVVLRANS